MIQIQEVEHCVSPSRVETDKGNYPIVQSNFVPRDLRPVRAACDLKLDRCSRTPLKCEIHKTPDPFIAFRPNLVFVQVVRKNPTVKLEPQPDRAAHVMVVHQTCKPA